MAAPNQAKTIRIVCISDTHSHYGFSIPPGDILIHAGDFSMTGEQHEIEHFLTCLKGLKQYRLKIIIAGNHELTLQTDFYEKTWERWHRSKKQNHEQIRLLMRDPALAINYGIIYLEQEQFTDYQTGLKFYGSPYQPVWARIPDDVDVLITHGPPANILDVNFRGDHTGCSQLLSRINQIKPRLHVSGHIHESYGRIEHNSTIFVNAAVCNIEYKPIQPPIIVDLEIKEKK